MGLDTTRCVVLNATYEPITIVSSKRALILYLEGKAMIVEEHPEQQAHFLELLTGLWAVQELAHLCTPLEQTNPLVVI